MRLQELQELFTNNSVAGSGSHSGELIDKVRKTRGISAERRLDVYRSNVTGLHLKTLDDTFPVTANVLGEQYWHFLLQNEIPSYSSINADLNSYGKFVPALLDQACSQRDELSDFAYLGDLARLEYIVFKTQLRCDDGSFDWGAFGNLTPEQQSSVRLVTSSSLTLFNSDYPVDALWFNHQDTVSEQEFDDAPDGIYCCIYRDDQFKISLERLSLSVADIMKRVLDGETLQELQSDDTIPPDELIKLLFSWIHRGWIVDFKEG